jgi:hypothetical protein
LLLLVPLVLLVLVLPLPPPPLFPLLLWLLVLVLLPPLLLRPPLVLHVHPLSAYVRAHCSLHLFVLALAFTRPRPLLPVLPVVALVRVLGCVFVYAGPRYLVVLVWPSFVLVCTCLHSSTPALASGRARSCTQLCGCLCRSPLLSCLFGLRSFSFVLICVLMGISVRSLASPVSNTIVRTCIIKKLTLIPWIINLDKNYDLLCF